MLSELPLGLLCSANFGRYSLRSRYYCSISFVTCHTWDYWEIICIWSVVIL